MTGVAYVILYIYLYILGSTSPFLISIVICTLHKYPIHEFPSMFAAVSNAAALSISTSRLCKLSLPLPHRPALYPLASWLLR